METTAVKYGILRKLPDLTFSEARERVTEALSREGFGILTEIDVQATLRKKLGVEFRPYLILGACNPSLAHQGLEKEPYLGLLLPCNVVIRESEEGGVVVSAMDPYAMMKVSENFDLEDVATEARERLKRAIESL